jgi:inosine-uridine nucleoside N-ribohydrolase
MRSLPWSHPLAALSVLAVAALASCGAGCTGGGPARVVFDTDLGNAIDDAFALAALHALDDEGEVEILAVTISKDNRWAAPFADLVGTFYGRPDLPIGAVVRGTGKTPEDGPYLREVATREDHRGRLLYSRDVGAGSEVPDAVAVLRRTLAAAPDSSVVLLAVGFLTNLQRLLESPPDAHSDLDGALLAARKVRLLVVMAGDFAGAGGAAEAGGAPREAEYNVATDLEAARAVFARWPGEIVASGFEVGEAVALPVTDIEHGLASAPQHPVRDALDLVRGTDEIQSVKSWDPTAVLFAAETDTDYFGLSPPGTIRVNESGVTSFEPNPEGRHRYLTITPEQGERVKERLVDLLRATPQGRR